jgi:hypothetical protein
VGPAHEGDRREPLPRRGTDRVERVAARLLSAMGLLALLAAVLTGARHHSAALEQGTGDAASRHVVEAVLLEAVPPGLAGVETGTRPLVTVPARYVDRRGVEHVAPVTVRQELPAGARVPVSVDAEGRVASPPMSASRALATALAVGVAVAAALAVLLLLAWFALRGVLGRLNAAAWAREWARVEPHWTRRAVDG